MEGYLEGSWRCVWDGGVERVVGGGKRDAEGAGLGWLGCGGREVSWIRGDGRGKRVGVTKGSWLLGGLGVRSKISEIVYKV